MDSDKLISFLKENVSLFEDFSDEELREILQSARVATIEQNESIIEFGEKRRIFGVILEGEAEASLTDDDGDKHVLGTLKKGDVFGEMSLMTGNKSMADVIGLTACEVLLIPQNVFSASISLHPLAIKFLSQTIIERLKTAAYSGKGGEVSASALKRSSDPYDLDLKTETPTKLLVLNTDPNTLKYRMFDTGDPANDAQGAVSKIGQEGTVHEFKSSRGEASRDLACQNHGEAVAAMLDELTGPNSGVIASPSEITAVGHRIVHGGDKYSNAIVINDEVIKAIEDASVLAPLHNPVALAAIHEARRRFPDVPHVAVFDTAFHQTLPPYAYLYGLPYSLYEENRIRRYGFHGPSHAYVSMKVAEFLNRPYNELETIVCHLGVGSSICAVDHGRSVDTSMGLTPAEGLMMATRAGDFDPAILLYLMKEKGMNHEQLTELINKKSGLLGLSGVSDDMREVEAAANHGHRMAMVAFKAFSYRIRKYIGAYAAAMGGVDAIAFTGGIGQGSAGVRSLACQGLQYMGVQIDEKKNKSAGGLDEIRDLSSPDSTVKILVVPTDEERMIARQTLRGLGRDYITNIIRSKEPLPIPLEVSAHHIHLAQEHVYALFGEGHELTVFQDLSQPGQYACEEKVNLIGPKGRVNNVRVLGPARSATQVEIALTEQFKLGVAPPIRESGNVKGSPGVTLEGTKGEVVLKEGVICALRHIHMTPEDALSLGLKDKDIVRVRVEGDRELIFGDVLVRVHPDFKLAMHIDTDEANAANIKTGVSGFIDSIQSRR